jgi:hypothetical protein
VIVSKENSTVSKMVASGQKVTVVPVSRLDSPLSSGAAGFWLT